MNKIGMSAVKAGANLTPIPRGSHSHELNLIAGSLPPQSGSSVALTVRAPPSSGQGAFRSRFVRHRLGLSGRGVFIRLQRQAAKHAPQDGAERNPSVRFVSPCHALSFRSEHVQEVGSFPQGPCHARAH